MPASKLPKLRDSGGTNSEFYWPAYASRAALMRMQRERRRKARRTERQGTPGKG